MAEKIYVGFAKNHTFPTGGSIVKLSFTLTQLKDLEQYVNEKGYLNLVLATGQSGKPYMYVDTFGLPSGMAAAPIASQGGVDGEDELPF